ncbi:EpsG family protein [Acinetobacter sp. YH12128]|uniref:EpsG family protein n=1 Tax=Acinetobacter sp. YH12128 TaxID=2601113 RepID=UPI0015D18DC7|nr:EpsG family protein [Acinetobacter sp. YH12128]
MKINVKILVALLLLMLFPFLGLIYSFFCIKGNNKNTIIFFIISLFYGIFFIRIPPMYDLHIRYWEIVSNLNNSMVSIWENNNDILLYITSNFILNIGLPFYFIPSLAIFLIVFLLLISYQNIYSECVNKIIDSRKFIFYVLLFVMYINFLNYGMGIRFGLGVAFIVYALSLIIKNNFKRALVILVLSVLMHFSMVIPAFAILISFFLKINKKISIILSVVALSVSELIIKKMVGNVDYFGLAEHATHYIDGQWSQAANNLNSRIIAYSSRIIFIIFIIFYFFSKTEINKMDNFINIMLIISSLFFFSFTMHGRYLSIISIILLIRGINSLIIIGFDTCLYKKLFRLFLIVIVSYNFLIAGIYANRRVIILGEMWKTLYTPPMFIIYNHGQKEFESYFMSIDENGYWKDSDQRQTD